VALEMYEDTVGASAADADTDDCTEGLVDEILEGATAWVQAGMPDAPDGFKKSAMQPGVAVPRASGLR
jgi:hypothetical protein